MKPLYASFIIPISSLDGCRRNTECREGRFWGDVWRLVCVTRSNVWATTQPCGD